MDDFGFERQQQFRPYFAGKEMVIFDIGANVGQSTTKYRSYFPEARVYAFEPHPDSYRQFIQAHGYDPLVFAYQAALGPQKGSQEFYATKVPEASSVLPPEPFLMERSPKRNYDFEKFSVQVLTLDQVMQEASLDRIDLLKIDIQGYEVEAFRGAKKSLRESKISIIYIEVLFAENYVGQCNFLDVQTFLDQYKYTLWDIFPFVWTSQGRLWTANAIFVSQDVLSNFHPQ